MQITDCPDASSATKRLAVVISYSIELRGLKITLYITMGVETCKAPWVWALS